MADELPKLSPKHTIAVDAYRDNGGDMVAAYLEAYPNSISWKPETTERKAKELFALKSVKAHLAAPPVKKPAKKKREKTPAQKANPPPRPPTKLTQRVRKVLAEYTRDYKEKYGHPFPSVAGLAKECDVHRDTIYAWARDPSLNLDLSDTLKKIESIQEFELITKGFEGDGNPTITKLLLTTKHGYIETQQVEHTGRGGGPIQTVGASISREMDPAEAAMVYRQMLSE